MLKQLAAKERTHKADLTLGCLLAFVAGALNAGGFMVVGYYTSHMTGIASSIADFIAVNKFYLAFVSALFIISFIVGAACSAIIINFARIRNFSSEFALPIMLEAVLLLLFGVFAGPGVINPPVDVTIALLCFIMGLQNAMITKISNSSIRTTHITGLATDIGIEGGRHIFAAMHGKDKVVLKKGKLKNLLSLLFSFIVGGLVGAYSFQQAGLLATIPLAMLLMVIAIAPLKDDFKGVRKP